MRILCWIRACFIVSLIFSAGYTNQGLAAPIVDLVIPSSSQTALPSNDQAPDQVYFLESALLPVIEADKSSNTQSTSTGMFDLSCISSNSVYRIHQGAIGRGETLIHNLQLGYQLAERHLQHISEVLIMDGSLYLPAQSPQLLHDFGLKALMAVSPHTDKNSARCWWLGPDGTAILRDVLSHPIDPERGWSVRLRSNIHTPATININESPSLEKTVHQFFDRVRRKEVRCPITGIAFRGNQNDTLDWYAITRTESALLEYERWAALYEWVTGKSPSNPPDGIWRRFLDDIAEEKPLDTLRESIDTQKQECLQQLSGKVNTAATLPEQARGAVIVWNPEPYPRTEIITVDLPAGCIIVSSTGSDVLQQTVDSQTGSKGLTQGYERIQFSAEGIPSFGYRIYGLLPGDPPRPRHWTMPGPARIRTHDLLVDLDPMRGGLVQIIHRDSEIAVVQANEGESALAVWLQSQSITEPFKVGHAACELWEGPLGWMVQVTPLNSQYAPHQIQIWRNDPAVRISTKGGYPLYVAVQTSSLQGNGLILGEPFMVTAADDSPIIELMEGQLSRCHSLRCDWADLSATAWLDVQGNHYPISSCRIVIPPASFGESAGFQLLQAFVRLGVPADVVRDDDCDANDIDDNFSLRIYVGNENSCPAMRDLLKGLPDSVYHFLQAQRAARGWGLALMDERNDTAGNIQTLLLYAEEERLADALDEILKGLMDGGEIRIHPRAYASSGSAPRSSLRIGKDGERVGLAVLSAGSFQISRHSTGQIQMSIDGTDSEVSFQLVPHNGMWRETALVRKAQAETMPCTTVVIPCQKGDWPASQSWLEIDSDSVLLSSLRMESGTIVIRLWESSGMMSNSMLRFASRIHRAALIDLRNRILDQLDIQKGKYVCFRSDPHDISTLRIELKK